MSTSRSTGSAAVWPKEKADTRAELLEPLDTGLSPADEAFLNQALNDTSKRVRATAAESVARPFNVQCLPARFKV